MALKDRGKAQCTRHPLAHQDRAEWQTTDWGQRRREQRRCGLCCPSPAGSRAPAFRLNHNRVGGGSRGSPRAPLARGTCPRQAQRGAVKMTAAGHKSFLTMTRPAATTGGTVWMT